MDRKDFFKRSLQASAGCGAMWILRGMSPTLGDAPQSIPAETACAEKQKFAQTWVQRLMQNMDAQLDEPTRFKLMESCGRACFVGANGERKSVPPTNEEVAGFLKGMKDRFGDDSVRQDGNDTLIYFRYTQNPKGLKVSEGYCLCPLVEDGPPRLSDTYCQCSVGYVRELFERSTGRPAEVVLMESLRRGGKICRFTVRVKGLSA